MDEDSYQEFLTQQSLEWDKMESVGWLAGVLVIFLATAAKGLLPNYLCVFRAWFWATYPSVLIPGLAAYTLPNFYTRWREAVVVLSKLLAAASYPVFRLSWQAPGTPLDVKAGFGSFWSRLPVHPLAVLQCGAVSMLSLSIRHSLRFRAQLLCQLAMLVVAMQAEAAAHRTAASPQQHFVSLRNATLLQLVCGALVPMMQHYQLDSRRRRRFRTQQRRQQQQAYEQQQLWPEALPQQQPEVRHGSGAARQRLRRE